MPGVAMTTALASLLTGRPVRAEVGMTGEVTLQGRVLPIGGVKQKVLAAHRAGLKEVILPARNEGDLDDVPEQVREEMTFHLAEDAADVLTIGLGPATVEVAEQRSRRVAARRLSPCCSETLRSLAAAWFGGDRSRSVARDGFPDSPGGRSSPPSRALLPRRRVRRRRGDRRDTLVGSAVGHAGGTPRSSRWSPACRWAGSRSASSKRSAASGS